jgi:hypothetical protein
VWRTWVVVGLMGPAATAMGNTCVAHLKYWKQAEGLSTILVWRTWVVLGLMGPVGRVVALGERRLEELSEWVMVGCKLPEGVVSVESLARRSLGGPMAIAESPIGDGPVGKGLLSAMSYRRLLAAIHG